MSRRFKVGDFLGDPPNDRGFYFEILAVLDTRYYCIECWDEHIVFQGLISFEEMDSFKVRVVKVTDYRDFE